MNRPSVDNRLQPFVDKMQAEHLPKEAIATFLHHLEHHLSGVAGTLGREEIGPIDSLPDSGEFVGFRESGIRALPRVAVIKLNGGLGTGMGLDKAKSLLTVRDTLSFLDLIALQVQAMRRKHSCRVPLLLMNSFRTDKDTRRALSRYQDLEVADLPLVFLQHRVPKLLVAGAVPALHPLDHDLEWCPPGHGDLYTAMVTSGVLDRLLDEKFEYVFASNADNLGAVLDLALLGYMVEERIEFMMEAADRTDADRKGGHLCRARNGRLTLRESAQCPADEEDEFQDVNLYRYFNTNNLWFHLPTLSRLMKDHDGVLPLATIVNRKTLDPRDPSSPPVVQLETAMGSAISLFDRAAAVRVPRTRFSPVKNTNDLLAVRSDAYQVTYDHQVVLHPDRDRPPLITLDEGYYKMIDDFDLRFPHGPPSLLGCDQLDVQGNVKFGKGVRVLGSTRISATDGAASLADGETVTGQISL